MPIDGFSPPQSLCDVIRFLDNAGIVSFRIVEVSTPSYYEFLVVLQKNTVNQPRVLDLSRNEEFLIDLTPNFMLESINFSNAADLMKPGVTENNSSVIHRIKTLLRALKEIKNTNHSKSK